jgi:hypothetical protein
MKIRSFEKSLDNKNSEELEKISKKTSGYTIEADKQQKNYYTKTRYNNGYRK